MPYGDIPTLHVPTPPQDPNTTWVQIATALQSEDHFTTVAPNRLSVRDGFFGEVIVEYLPARALVHVWCLGNPAKEELPRQVIDLDWETDPVRAVRLAVEHVLRPDPDWGELNGASITADVLLAIRDESIRAHLKHGPYSLLGDALDLAGRITALGEEFGEVCRALTYDNDHNRELEIELIQLANVAGSWVTHLWGHNGRAIMRPKQVKITGAKSVRSRAKAKAPMQVTAGKETEES